MAVTLDLADIQGNILRAYGKYGLPKGRFITLHIDDAKSGRRFVNELLPKITTERQWQLSIPDVPPFPLRKSKLEVTINVAFSWYGLVALGIPTRTLSAMPDEFINGMMERAPMLGDKFGIYDPMTSWDHVWTAANPRDRLGDPNTVHILVTLNAQMDPKTGSPVPGLDAKTRDIEALCESIGGIRILEGHNRPGQPAAKYQELTLLLTPPIDGKVEVLPTEHFGFVDGIGDPVFDGQYDTPYSDNLEKKLVVGNGAVDGSGKWRPIATGEFLLGYPDEAQETAGGAMPLEFSRNGTFMAYRKVHQNVVAFKNCMDEAARRFGAVFGIDDHAVALNTLKAKMAGRWPDGVPLSVAPTAEAWVKFQKQYTFWSPEWWARIMDFTYHDDFDGIKCPITAHMRRVNTRDSLAPTGKEGSVLNNRRRIIRRGLTYGELSPHVTDMDEHGVVMLVVCASLSRQFEFVQQQWINYGFDFNAGNDTCPLTGNHIVEGEPKAKFVIAADPASGRPPFIMEGIPQFVETRGGEYFFIPSMTALSMIGMGVVDPT